MKILILRNFPTFMSVKNNTYNIQEVGLAKALVRKGHICDIVFWTDKQEETVIIPVEGAADIHVFYKRGKTCLKNTIFRDIDALVDSYDILQPCEYNQMQAWLLAKRLPEKTIIYHGPYYSRFNKRYNLMCKIFDALFLKQYIKQGTNFLTKSELAKKFLIEKGIPENKVCTVGVGIDVQMLSTKKEICTEPLYQAMQKQKSGMKLLYIGRFEARRNIPFIVDVFKNVVDKNADSRLYMVGTGDPEYLKMVFTYIENQGIRDKIVWQERMEQKYLSSIYQQADFFLLPTEYEIFGMVLLEAMYYGNVVLTTYNGGSSTLIDNGRNGFSLREKDAEIWANKILNMSEEQKKDIQKNAHDTVADGFTWDKLADNFLREYNNETGEKY